MRRLWFVPTYLILFLMGVGFLGAYSGLLGPGPGFQLFFFGAGIAILSAVGLGGAAAVASALGREWRQPAVRGAILPLLVTVWILGGRVLNPVPTLNDVTTDPVDPPAFENAAEAAGAEYPLEFAPQQADAYPEVQPIETADAVPAAFARALATARAMPHWQVGRADSEAGVIEAVATTSLFRFQDDVVIRVRPRAEGARVDVRSRSRIGRSDLGANAARIVAFRRSFETGVASR